MINRSRGSSERVCVFIDNSSLLEAMKRSRSNVRYDFKRLKDWLLKQRIGEQARFYCGGGNNRSRFYNVLRHAGFEVVPVKTPRRSLEIVFDLCNCCDGVCGTIILVSGRAELSKVVLLLTSKGTEVELVFFEDFCSQDLLATATTFRNLRVDGLELQRGSRKRGVK